jgi:NitT/TauT family transport system substrate-binding protein
MKRIVLLAIACAIVAASTPARAAQIVHFTLPSIQAFEAPYLVAQQKGYFADEGLDVQFVTANGGVAIPALISGSVDASASGASALAAIMKGAALRIVLVQQSRPIYQLWSTRPDIRTLQDLKGKQIAIEARGGSDEIAARIAFSAAGVNPDDVTYFPLGTANAASAITGQVPAFVLGTNDVTHLRASGLLAKAHLIVDYSKVEQMPINGLAVSQKLVTDNPELLHKLLRAIVKGLMYVRTYKQQTVAIVLKAGTASTAPAVAEDYDWYLATVTPRLDVSNDVAKADIDVHAALLSMPRDKVPSVDQVYDFVPLHAAQAEVTASGWKPKA